VAGRKSAEVKAAVALVTSGKVKTAYQAAKQTGVAESSVRRDADFMAWYSEQKKKEGGK
jgi:hypothetical protein